MGKKKYPVLLCRKPNRTLLVPKLRLGTSLPETLFPTFARRPRNGVSQDEVPKRSLGTSGFRGFSTERPCSVFISVTKGSLDDHGLTLCTLPSRIEICTRPSAHSYSHSSRRMSPLFIS